MSAISSITAAANTPWQLPGWSVRIQIESGPCSPEEVVSRLAAVAGPVDVFCWYEGSNGLPADGALFMKDNLLKPLMNLKKEAKLYLYSLNVWNFKKVLSAMPGPSKLCQAINKINKASLECLYSSSFFRYCQKASDQEALYQFMQQELPKKQWLLDLSKNKEPIGLSVKEFFGQRKSFFDCIKELDVQAAYSCMQYLEGYYLIRESVRKGLSEGKSKLQLAFVLPNDEGKYYRDLPRDIEQMLSSDFGEALWGVEIEISFQFFTYGGSPDARPYASDEDTPKVRAREVGSYFDFMQIPASIPKSSARPFLRDVIHNLNGGC